MSGLLQSLLLAAFTGWLGYAAAGRRWRQAERRSVYRDYLVAADEVLRLLRKFEEEWNAKPDALPALYGELMEKNLQLDTKAQEVSLISPLKVWTAAANIPMSVDSLMDELVYNEGNDD